MHCDTISSCQSATTSEIMYKALLFLSLTRVISAKASVQTTDFNLYSFDIVVDFMNESAHISILYNRTRSGFVSSVNSLSSALVFTDVLVFLPALIPTMCLFLGSCHQSTSVCDTVIGQQFQALFPSLSDSSQNFHRFSE